MRLQTYRPANRCKTILALPLLALFLGMGGASTLAADKLTGDVVPATGGDVIIHPINHATFAMSWSNKVIYADPVGGANRFDGLPRPDLILLTHAHSDHFSVETLQAVAGEKTVLVAPPSVAGLLPEKLRAQTTVMTNGETKIVAGISIEAVAAYNTTPAHAQFHPKGAGNGYVVTLGNRRIYVSGDTEDIPELRALKNIDVAFICVNQPYTMTEEQAADAVRVFKPKIVYPYHSRGSDLEKFKSLVVADSGIEVRLRNWY
jgi:L-ascorbate metabolism protein UlaG (beta-lactamase superfamily)